MSLQGGCLVQEKNGICVGSIHRCRDVDYARLVTDRRSTSVYSNFLGENLVTWRSKKQNVMARSIVEAEFRAMAQRVCELLLLKISLEDLETKWDGPIRLYCDNISAISIAHNLVQHDQTKLMKWIDISSRRSWIVD